MSHNLYKRCWLILGDITEDDVSWIVRSKLAFKPGEQKYLDFVDIGTKNHVKLAGKKHPAEIITTSETEETWLKLYFADRAILLTEELMYDKYH